MGLVMEPVGIMLSFERSSKRQMDYGFGLQLTSSESKFYGPQRTRDNTNFLSPILRQQRPTRARILNKCCFPDRPPMDIPSVEGNQKATSTAHTKKDNWPQKGKQFGINVDVVLSHLGMSLFSVCRLEDSAKVTHWIWLLESLMTWKYGNPWRPPIERGLCAGCSNCCVPFGERS